MSPANLNWNCVLPVPIGSSRNSNFEADVLESTYSRALLPMIFVISIFELTKTARSALKVEKQVGSVYLSIFYQKFGHKERMNYNSPNSLVLWAKEGYSNISYINSILSQNERIWTIVIHSLFVHKFLIQTILDYLLA